MIDGDLSGAGNRNSRRDYLRWLPSKPLPQTRDRKVQKGAQFQWHLALAGIDEADRIGGGSYASSNVTSAPDLTKSSIWYDSTRAIPAPAVAALTAASTEFTTSRRGSV